MKMIYFLYEFILITGGTEMKNVLKKTLSVVLACLMLTGGAAVASAADNTVKNVSCTMYGDGATGRGFCWFTTGKAGSDLQIVKTSEFNGSFENAKTYQGTENLYRKQYSHQVAVTELEAGTAYTYRVGDAAANVWSDAKSFVTDDRDDAFKFITIADVQASSDENFAHAALTLKGALDTMPDAEFTINLGDYVNDNTNEEWDWYFSNFAFANDKITQVPVAGNHDGNITNKFNTNCFKNTFCLDQSKNESIEGVYYSFDYGNAHFAVLNTNDMYPMSQAQRNWLINDMSNSNARWKIVLAHRSFYSAGKNINKPDTIIMRNVLLPIIDKLGIDMVYAGHDHMYLRTNQVKGDALVENVTYVDEIYNGEKITFAVNPDGTVYTLPSTAGTKRYTVHEDAIPPVLDVAAVAETTRDRGGCFCTTEINGDKLIYKAYIVDDDTQEISLIDTYAIKKTAVTETEGTDLPDGLGITFAMFFVNFVTALFGMFKSYFGMLLHK